MPQPFSKKTLAFLDVLVDRLCAIDNEKITIHRSSDLLQPLQNAIAVLPQDNRMKKLITQHLQECVQLFYKKYQNKVPSKQKKKLHFCSRKDFEQNDSESIRLLLARSAPDSFVSCELQTQKTLSPLFSMTKVEDITADMEFTAVEALEALKFYVHVAELYFISNCSVSIPCKVSAYFVNKVTKSCQLLLGTLSSGKWEDKEPLNEIVKSSYSLLKKVIVLPVFQSDLSRSDYDVEEKSVLYTPPFSGCVRSSSISDSLASLYSSLLCIGIYYPIVEVKANKTAELSSDTDSSDEEDDQVEDSTNSNTSSPSTNLTNDINAVIFLAAGSKVSLMDILFRIFTLPRPSTYSTSDLKIIFSKNEALLFELYSYTLSKHLATFNTEGARTFLNYIWCIRTFRGFKSNKQSSDVSRILLKASTVSCPPELIQWFGEINKGNKIDDIGLPKSFICSLVDDPSKISKILIQSDLIGSHFFVSVLEHFDASYICGDSFENDEYSNSEMPLFFVDNVGETNDDAVTSNIDALITEKNNAEAAEGDVDALETEIEVQKESSPDTQKKQKRKLANSVSTRSLRKKKSTK